MYHRHLTTALSCLALLAYGGPGIQPAADEPHGWDGEVQAYGALRAMFHDGQTGAMLPLNDLLPNQELYAVGALADLAGEITVVGGKTYLSYPADTDATRTESVLESDAAATLLVVSAVPTWQTYVTERAIGFEELGEEIEKLATAAGMNLDRRFPFLIEGELEDLEWHVIDGRRLTEGGESHQDHLAAAVKTKLDRSSATLIGFYSNSDQGVFTHMGSMIHVHCTVDEPLSSGHVDHVTLPVGTTVKFPSMGDERQSKGHDE